jgi:hypothetical protein
MRSGVVKYSIDEFEFSGLDQGIKNLRPLPYLKCFNGLYHVTVDNLDVRNGRKWLLY